MGQERASLRLSLDGRPADENRQQPGQAGKADQELRDPPAAQVGPSLFLPEGQERPASCVGHDCQDCVVQMESNHLDDAQEQPGGAAVRTGLLNQFVRDTQQGQVDQWKQGIATDLLGVDDRQGG